MTSLREISFAVVLCCLPASLFAQAIGGVYIDTKGMLNQTKHITDNAVLKKLQSSSANQIVPLDLSKQSKLRKISLLKLEALIKKAKENGEELPPEVKYLAGMIQIEAVFFYPEQNDVVIAGPAEGWKQLESGEVVGRQSNRPVLHLDNLLVALRYVFARQQQGPFIGVSIEPTPEGLKNYRTYSKSLGGRITRNTANQIFAGMRQAMGPQAVKLYGIPKSSRFALTMLAADYRMKRISFAHDPSPSKKVVSYLDLESRINKKSAGSQALYRWWFLAKYDAILHTEDRTAFRFSGQGLELLSAKMGAGLPSQQLTTKKGKKKKSSIGKAAKQFADSFTKNFPEIAARVPIFAELQNCIALSVVSQLIHDESKSQKTWQPTFLLDNEKCPIEKFEIPQNVPSLLNYRYTRNRSWLIAISGGVRINPESMIPKEIQKATTDRVLLSSWNDSKPTNKDDQKNNNWWWD